ncbi:PilZ domain-containing protein [Bradyrhizobium sp. 2TAF24]|uniref:PilZ domain-containing protein n=1 Tax=Bradyrhizobium sp. 2TAF24 TaxID=3233011 RepID=UPI003F8DDEF3
MPAERAEIDRVTFSRGITAHLMGIDGTWRRNCVVESISDTNASLIVEGSVEGLNLKEFFLLLSSTGLVYRRCELERLNGDQLEVRFLKQMAGKKKKSSQRQGAAYADE